MSSSPVIVQCTFNYHFPCVSVLCLPLQNVYCLITPFFYTLSIHHLFGLPLLIFPSISQNTTSFTSLLFSILQMCLNKFNFLSLILCKMFLLLPKVSILFLISSFLYFFVAILHLEFFGSISSQMTSVCSCLFFFTCIQYYADDIGYHFCLAWSIKLC